jgi:hypothetical protein
MHWAGHADVLQAALAALCNLTQCAQVCKKLSAHHLAALVEVALPHSSCPSLCCAPLLVY